MTSISRLLTTELTDLDLSAHVENPVDQLSVQDTNVVSLRRAKNKPLLINGFDYTGVPKSVIKEAEATAIRIRDRNRAHSIDTGNELLNIKQKLEHGKFGKWLKFHFGWKERTAQNYMNSATAFGSTPRVVDLLPPSTVYKLAAKSTPDGLRQSVIEEINQGGTPDPKKIEKRIAEAKTEARPKTNSDESLATGELNAAKDELKPDLTKGGTYQIPSAEAPLEEDNGVIVEAQASKYPDARHTERQQTDARVHELRAKRITEHLKKRFGVHFHILRDAILHTDLSALRKALSEA